MEEKILEILDRANFPFYDEKAKGLIIENTLIFLKELQKWSSRISLISKTDQSHILERHFAESLEYLKGLKGTTRLVDIGSGAGFPGIPIKICFPDLKILLVESQRKRAGFLESVLRKMSLKNYEVAFGRAEEISLKKEYKQSFDTATFRSVTSLEKCLIIGAPFLKNKGKALLKKEIKFENQGIGNMIFSEEFFFETKNNRKSKLMIFNKSST